MKKKKLRLKKNIKQTLLSILALITGLSTIVAIIGSILKSLNGQILWIQFCIGFSAFLIGTIVICLISDSIEESGKQKRLMSIATSHKSTNQKQFATRV